MLKHHNFLSVNMLSVSGRHECFCGVSRRTALKPGPSDPFADGHYGQIQQWSSDRDLPGGRVVRVDSALWNMGVGGRPGERLPGLRLLLRPRLKKSLPATLDTIRAADEIGPGTSTLTSSTSADIHYVPIINRIAGQLSHLAAGRTGSLRKDPCENGNLRRRGGTIQERARRLPGDLQLSAFRSDLSRGRAAGWADRDGNREKGEGAWHPCHLSAGD